MDQSVDFDQISQDIKKVLMKNGWDRPLLLPLLDEKYKTLTNRELTYDCSKFGLTVDDFIVRSELIRLMLKNGRTHAYLAPEKLEQPLPAPTLPPQDNKRKNRRSGKKRKQSNQVEKKIVKFKANPWGSFEPIKTDNLNNQNSKNLELKARPAFDMYLSEEEEEDLIEDDDQLDQDESTNDCDDFTNDNFNQGFQGGSNNHQNFSMNNATFQRRTNYQDYSTNAPPSQRRIYNMNQQYNQNCQQNTFGFSNIPPLMNDNFNFRPSYNTEKYIRPNMSLQDLSYYNMRQREREQFDFNDLPTFRQVINSNGCYGPQFN